jgi:hypothetical protein
VENAVTKLRADGAELHIAYEAGRLCLGHAPPGARPQGADTGRPGPATSVTAPFSDRPAGAASFVPPTLNPFPVL